MIRIAVLDFVVRANGDSVESKFASRFPQHNFAQAILTLTVPLPKVAASGEVAVDRSGRL